MILFVKRQGTLGDFGSLSSPNWQAGKQGSERIGLQIKDIVQNKPLSTIINPLPKIMEVWVFPLDLALY